ncbi:SDR family oxidoreductase [Hirschia maritima]|uniref:SDR family oxidoreductase n=1 Tax=Hirschia maritima TaxID=1121961 RepID=UPI000367B8A2|nr:SDR family oxidoreductase [Hirschia maritima]
MSQRWLILGATGLLGPCFVKEIKDRGYQAITAARSNADVCFDLSDQSQLHQTLEDTKPDSVINCAANIYVDLCENDPAGSYLLNTRPLSTLADWSRENDKPLLQVSTDHYFTQGGNNPQSEDAPVDLVNEYARSKYLAEHLALTAPKALVLRTNIVGAQKGHGRWVKESLLNKAPMTLFMDFFASPLHVQDMARISLDLAQKQANGIYNVSSRDVSSKGEFIYAVAKAMNINPDWVIEGTGHQLATKRAMCLGLDVSKAESTLGYQLPTLEETAKKLANEAL